MALTDINFQEGESVDFINEIPLGGLGTPTDIIVEDSGSQTLLTEVPEVTGGGNIFIMSE